MSGGDVNLSWDATDDDYASGHRVLRGTDSGGPYSQIAEVTPRTTTTYPDSPADGTYYYVLRAFYQSWESANSNEASATVSTAEIWYLHNNPTPPTGDTTSQAVLPLDQTAPTATTLYNYDTDRDGAAGRMVDKGGSGAGETDLSKYQAWRSAALGSNLTIDGTVTVNLWSAIKDFNTGKRGNVTVFLRDYNGSSYTEICDGNLTEKPWSGGASWVLKTFQFACVSYTIPAGNFLEVKLIVGNSAGDAMWFAYDTTSYDSRVQLP